MYNPKRLLHYFRWLSTLVVCFAVLGCAGTGKLTATFPKSGSRIDYEYAGTLLSKTKYFVWDGEKLTMVEPDNSPLLSMSAWGLAAKEIAPVLGDAVSEVTDAVKD